MDLYIQIRDGVPFEHPIFAENFKQSFPNIDVNNLPNNFARFIRVEQPSNSIMPVGVFELPIVSYVLDDDGKTWKDSWSVRDMTEDEKNIKIEIFKSCNHFPSWTFNENTCTWDPPTPKPQDGFWNWDEETLSWVDTTPPELQLSSVRF